MFYVKIRTFYRFIVLSFYRCSIPNAHYTYIFRPFVLHDKRVQECLYGNWPILWYKKNLYKIIYAIYVRMDGDGGDIRFTYYNNKIYIAKIANDTFIYKTNTKSTPYVNGRQFNTSVYSAKKNYYKFFFTNLPLLVFFFHVINTYR